MDLGRTAFQTGFVFLAAAAILLAGCDGNSLKSDPAVFKNASAEVKQLWADSEKAVAANDYASAKADYVSLLRQPLTTDQAETVSAALTALRQRVDAAAVKGDAAAKKATERPKR
jgi:hypothetical protein